VTSGFGKKSDFNVTPDQLPTRQIAVHRQSPQVQYQRWEPEEDMVLDTNKSDDATLEMQWIG
jgi:hypothetical protein